MYVAGELYKVASGSSHVKDIVRTAQNLKSSGRCDSGISVLSNLNMSSGERDMHRKLKHILGDELPEPYPLELTVQVGRRKQTMCFHAINPFDTLNVLSRHVEQWQSALLGNYHTSVLAPYYWEHMRSTSWARDGVSNMFKSAELWNRRSKVFPTLWHSDDGEVYAGGKVWSIYHVSTPFTYDQDAKDAKLYVLMVEEAFFCEETEKELTEYTSFGAC